MEPCIAYVKLPCLWCFTIKHRGDQCYLLYLSTFLLPYAFPVWYDWKDSLVVFIKLVWKLYGMIYVYWKDKQTAYSLTSMCHWWGRLLSDKRQCFMTKITLYISLMETLAPYACDHLASSMYKVHKVADSINNDQYLTHNGPKYWYLFCVLVIVLRELTSTETWWASLCATEHGICYQNHWSETPLIYSWSICREPSLALHTLRNKSSVRFSVDHKGSV